MAYFEFPHTRTYDSDLGWLIKHTKKLIKCCDVMTAWKAAHEEDYEELVNKVNGLINSLIEVIRPWDPGIEYQPFSIVEYQGQNYIAVQEVPVGAMITDTEYWQPANTVIEQINAIGVVVDNIQKMWNVVEDFDDLKETTTDRVIVLNDDGYYGSGCMVIYGKTEDPLPQHDNSAYQRTNGDWMIPLPRYDAVTPNAPMTAISKVIASYVKESGLVASQDNDINPFRMDLPAGSMNGMDCSTFINLVIKGITYENSRYLATNPVMKYGPYVGNNQPRNPYSTRPGFPDLYMYKAAELALWYAEQNRLFYVDYSKERPASQLAPGDLIFMSYTPNDRYLSIGHVSMVLNVFPESNRVMIAQCGGPGNNIAIRSTNPSYNAARLSILEITQADGIYTYARPCYAAGPASPYSMLYSSRDRGVVASPATAGGISNLHLMYLSEYLSTDDLYTYTIEGDLPDYDTDKARLTLYHNMPGGGSFYQYLTGIKEPGRVTVTLPAPETPTGETYIDVRAQVATTETDITQRNLHIKKADIIKGCITDAAATGSSFDAVLTVSQAGVSAYAANRAYVTPKGTQISVSIKVTTAQAASFTLGTLDTSAVPTSAVSRQLIASHNSTHEIVGLTIAANTNEVTAGPMIAGDWSIYGIV